MIIDIMRHSLILPSTLWLNGCVNPRDSKVGKSLAEAAQNFPHCEFILKTVAQTGNGEISFKIGYFQDIFNVNFG